MKGPLWLCSLITSNMKTENSCRGGRRRAARRPPLFPLPLSY